MIKETQRTSQQRKALEVYCKTLAEALNEAGITQAMLLKDFELDHSQESIKNIFREVGRIKYLKDSTAKLTTKEVTEIYDELNRQTAKYGIHIVFPSVESMIDYSNET